jgi:hypothetical protein
VRPSARRRLSDGAGVGEVLLMIAIMIAAQAEIIRRRATELPGGDADRSRSDSRAVNV